MREEKLEEEEESKMSKDKKVNAEGKVLIRTIEKLGWSIFFGIETQREMKKESGLIREEKENR